MRKLTFKHIEERIKQPVAELPEHSYEFWVLQTAKLIRRSYISTHKLVEGWPLAKIIQRHELCTKHAGTMPGDVKWWWLRKQDGQAQGALNPATEGGTQPPASRTNGLRGD
jgi:hypothetical protein